MNNITIVLISIFCCLSSFGQTLTNGEYFIKVKQTGKYLAIAGAATNNGSRLVQWDNEYKQHFMFTIQHLGNNVYSLEVKHSRKYLSTEGTPQTGAKLIQWDWLNQDNQKWYIIQQPGSRYYTISCLQNNMKATLQYWGASTNQPANGSYFFLKNDISVPHLLFDFKKNEVN
jgi:Ricin-type beta-trefoil lectin domain-like